MLLMCELFSDEAGYWCVFKIQRKICFGGRHLILKKDELHPRHPNTFPLKLITSTEQPVRNSN